MYHYVDDKEFLKKMRGECSNIINQLIQCINNDGVMKVEAYLVGSGANHLETQNGNEPIDLDYNLNIVDISFNINDGKSIKDYVIKMFNKVLESNKWANCSDSTSALTTKYRNFTSGNKTPFKIDLAIVHENKDGSWYRLIHQKTGIVSNDSWIWNQGPASKGLVKKVNYIKNSNCWNEVREKYLDIKNMYLTKNNYNHPSFNCYIETINEIYKKHGGK